MLMRSIFSTTVLLLLLSLHAMAEDIDQVRLQLIENQRTMLQLRKDKQEAEAALKLAQEQLAINHNPELQSQIIKLQNEITDTAMLLQSFTTSVYKQRMNLLTLERGTPPTSLDIALNKALNSNLPELAKKLADNEDARKEIARLQLLLKEEARVGAPLPISSNAVSLAAGPQNAEEEFLRMLALFSDGEADETVADKAIKITGISKRNTYVANETLNYLGHQQYHMETTVHVGEMTFTVDDRPWQLSVSDEEDGATYIVIYDINIAEKPRLVMFNKNLLLE